MKRKYEYPNYEEYDCFPCGWSWREVFFKRNSGALEILKKRYANGEISKEEFENMKKDIT